ncbi:MAG: hypothetical protein JOZ05_17820 [Acetobacteraceae bacterium]|nr:hypothetical protein [Acetobacteraceae bacterium]
MKLPVLALAALLAAGSRAAAEELRLYCKTDVIAFIGHHECGTPWGAA